MERAEDCVRKNGWDTEECVVKSRFSWISWIQLMCLQTAHRKHYCKTPPSCCVLYLSRPWAAFTSLSFSLNRIHASAVFSIQCLKIATHTKKLELFNKAAVPTREPCSSVCRRCCTLRLSVYFRENRRIRQIPRVAQQNHPTVETLNSVELMVPCLT